MTIFKNEKPYSVLVGDSTIKDPKSVLDWCRKVNEFQGVIETDVSDVSYSEDTIYTYMFETEEAANWFRLRWL